MIPEKLKINDEVRVVAPARSISILNKEVVDLAVKRLKDLGLNVTYGKNIKSIDEFSSSSIQERVEDIHDAFSDNHVKAILSVIGGFNSNQILSQLDYELIKNNPKIICGFSDITALNNAIYAKTGLTTYSGPHFFSFGMKKGLDYTIDYFKKCLMSDDVIDIEPSTEWSDDPWFQNQEDRIFIENQDYIIINEGCAEGISIGGNLCTLNLLQGTDYMPSLENSILLIEDDNLIEEYFAYEFDRNLQSLVHQKDFKGVKGIIIGRFQKACNINLEKLKKIISSKKELSEIPIIYGVDFGHTTPIITFPIGGSIKVKAENNKVKLSIIKH